MSDKAQALLERLDIAVTCESLIDEFALDRSELEALLKTCLDQRRAWNSAIRKISKSIKKCEAMEAEAVELGVRAAAV